MTHVYVGAYTAPQGRASGVAVYDYNAETGALDHIQTLEGLANPSYLAASPDGRFVYVAAEGDDGQIVACARDPQSGHLTELNRQSSGGAGPCHVSLDLSDRYVLAANYASGEIAVLPIDVDGALQSATGHVQHAGDLGPNADRQDGPHAHMILPSPDGRWILATDLGLDEVITYTLDPAEGTLTRQHALATHPGAGPRHLAFSPDGTKVYVINELDSTLTACAWDPAAGTLTPLGTVPTLPEGFTDENTTAHVVVSPDGGTVYGSNRGHHSIATFAVQPDGTLEPTGHVATGGETPRNFGLDPSGERLLVANQDSDTVVVFRRDATTGALTDPVTIHGVLSPVALLFVEGDTAEA